MFHPTVFISYSHDDQEHKLWVLNLATRLRTNGVDAILDQWDLGPGGDLPQFMEQSIARSARILMVCTERYVLKANAGTGGVGYEKMIVTSDLIDRIGSNKVIPIVRQKGLIKVPTFIGSKLYIDLSTDDQFETGFDQMLRELLNAPLYIKPPLGVAPTLTAGATPRPTLPDPLEQFMIALALIYDMSNSNGTVKMNSIFIKMGVSKLQFDYALDLAIQNKFVIHILHQSISVQPAGRVRMLELQARQESGTTPIHRT